MGAVRRNFLPLVPRGRNLVWILLCCAALGPRALSQTAAEAAGATSVAAGAAANAKSVALPNPIPSDNTSVRPNPTPSQNSQTSPHIVGSPSRHTVESNRQALEAKARADGARVLLRSTPSEAQVWINNQPVGNTPLLLIVPPGKYTVEMRGTRQETGRQELSLLPKETREVALKLELHYPTRVVAAH
jgi:PEGA domain